MKFTVDGQTYEWEERMTMVEARLVKKLTRGMGYVDVLRGLAKGDPDAWCAVILMAKQRAGETPRWKDFDNLALDEVIESVEDTALEEGEDVDLDSLLDDDLEASLDPTDTGATRSTATTAT